MEENEEVQDIDFSVKDLETLRKIKAVQIMQNKEKLEKTWENIMKFSDEKNKSNSTESLNRNRLRAIRLRENTEELFDQIQELTEYIEDFPECVNKIEELNAKSDLIDDEVLELVDLQNRYRTIRAEIEDCDGFYLDDIKKIVSGELSFESYKAELEESEEEIKKFIENIDKEYDEFISYNTKLFADNNEKLETFYLEFLTSLDDRKEVIEDELLKAKEMIDAGVDNEELFEKEKKLNSQLNDIENDKKVLENWLENKKKLSENLEKMQEISEENIKLKKEIKELKEYINNPENKENTDEINDKKQKLKSIYKTRNNNFKEIKNIKNKNNKLLDKIENINDSFKTVHFELSQNEQNVTNDENAIVNANNQQEVKIKKEESINKEKVDNKKGESINKEKVNNKKEENVNEVVEDVTQEVKNAKKENSSKEEKNTEKKKEENSNKKQNAIMRQQQTEQTPTYSQAQTYYYAPQENKVEKEEKQEENLELPQMTYREILNKYVNEGKDTKSKMFLENNFSSLMLAIYDADKHGKLNGFQRDRLKAHFDLHKQEIESKMKNCNPNVITYIATKLYSDDPEKLYKYTHIENEGTRKINDDLFTSMYTKTKNGFKFNKLVDMDDNVNGFISDIFMVYSSKVKNGEISKDDEIHEIFANYIANPVKFQMVSGPGYRVCSKIRNFVQKIKNTFSKTAREKFEKENNMSSFFIKVDKATKSKYDNKSKLDLSASVNECPANNKDKVQSKERTTADREIR